MALDNVSSIDQAQIRRVIESSADAIRAKDVDAVMANYAPDLVVFDMTPPLQVNAQGYRQNFARWFASVEGPIDYEIGQLRIAASGDLGVCSMIGRVKSTDKRGKKRDGGVRVTTSLRKIDGKWLVVHEHVSVPLDMTTGEALMSLAP
jgi:uncharacterized protein (TIGR02246 family)